MSPEPFHDPDAAALMARAIELARRGLYSTDPNPRVGCVIVQEGRIVGEGWHHRAGEAHAEVIALREAGAAARGSRSTQQRPGGDRRATAPFTPQPSRGRSYMATETQRKIMQVSGSPLRSYMITETHRKILKRPKLKQKNKF